MIVHWRKSSMSVAEFDFQKLTCGQLQAFDHERIIASFMSEICA